MMNLLVSSRVIPGYQQRSKPLLSAKPLMESTWVSVRGEFEAIMVAVFQDRIMAMWSPGLSAPRFSRALAITANILTASLGGVFIHLVTESTPPGVRRSMESSIASVV